jgi:hypothetical protein
LSATKYAEVDENRWWCLLAAINPAGKSGTQQTRNYSQPKGVQTTIESIHKEILKKSYRENENRPMMLIVDHLTLDTF